VQNAKENRTKLGRAGNFEKPQGDWGGAGRGGEEGIQKIRTLGRSDSGVRPLVVW